jgi:hypothetical protein
MPLGLFARPSRRDFLASGRFWLRAVNGFDNVHQVRRSVIFEAFSLEVDRSGCVYVHLKSIVKADLCLLCRWVRHFRCRMHSVDELNQCVGVIAFDTHVLVPLHVVQRDFVVYREGELTKTKSPQAVSRCGLLCGTK